MLCPVCSCSDHELILATHDNGFDEDLYRCKICKALWSVNHGTLEVVEESAQNSFLAGTTEPVEADDYNQGSPRT